MRQQDRRDRRRRRGGIARLEWLEGRQLMAAPDITAISNVSLPAGKTLFVPVAGSDADGDPITYTVSSSNTEVTAQVRSGHPFLKIAVEGYGDLVFQLFDDLAPQTVQTMTARLGSISDQEFYRVVKDFVIQGGNPSNTSPAFGDEFHPSAIFTGSGQLAMANSGKDTNSSQFFVTVGPQRFLDFNHAIWGQLVRGQNVLTAINSATTNGSQPTPAIKINSVSIVPDTTDTVLLLKAPAGAGQSTITVTARDPGGNTTSRTFDASYAADTTNDPPILGPVISPTTAVGTPISINLTSTDLENDPVEYAAAILSGGGTATVNGNTVTITPPAGSTTPIQVRVGVKQQGATSRGSTPDPYDYETITVSVVNPTLAATGVPLTGTVGTTISGVVARFTATPSSPASSYAATVSFGDGSSAPGTIVATATGFDVVASHTYSTTGSFPIGLAIVGPGTSTATASTTATVTAAQAGTLGLTVTDSPDPVTAGQPLTYTIVVTNPGSTANAGVTLTQTLPTGTSFVSSTITPSSTSATQIVIPVGDLAAGASRTVQIVVTPSVAGNIASSFVVSSPTTNTPVTDTELTVVTAATTVNPITGPQVVDLSRQGIHTDPTRITLTFNSNLDPARAQNPANYRLVSPGKDKTLGSRDDVGVPIVSATYDAATQTVTLVPKYRLNWYDFAQIRIVSGGASGLTDTDGRALDGDRNGQPGTEFVARFARGVYFDLADRLARADALFNGQQVPRGPMARSMATGELYTGPIYALLSNPDSASFRAAVATLPPSAFTRVPVPTTLAATAHTTLVKARKAPLG